MKQAPGPKGLSVLRSILAMRRSDPLSFWRNAHATYGDTVKMKLGPMDLWSFASPDALYEVLVTQNRTMRKGLGYAGLRKLLGEGLITTDKEHWSSQRRRLNPLFTPAAIDAYSGSVFDACIAGLGELKELASQGKPIDLGYAMTRLTMRVISRAAFGADLAEGHDEIVDAFEFAFAFVADITAEPVRAPLFVPTLRNRRFKKELGVIETFVDRLIDQSMSEPTTDGMKGKIFSALNGIDRKLLRDEVISLYFAGFETTARTMTFLMYLLPKHPEVMDVLRAEAENLERPGDLDSMTKRLPYATEVVNEALRLFPPVAMMARQPNSDCIIDGYQVRANSMVIICPFVAQRNAAFWPAAESFAPSLAEPLEKRLSHRGSFAPFGAGPRMCLGKHFAMVELVIAITLIAENFEWELEDQSPVELDFHGTLRPSVPIFANLTMRRSA